MDKKTKEVEVVESEITLDDKALKAITEKVTEKITPMINDTLTSAIAKFEPAIKKNFAGGKKSDAEDTNVKVEDSATKEVKLLRAVKALVNGNYGAVRKYNKEVIAYRIKSGYANETVDADGGYLVMMPEFEAEIEKISPVYGVGLQDATVRTIEGNEVWTNKRGTNVTMYDTAEAAAKTGTKMTISQIQVTLRKFAAIAPVTDELSEDSAVDFWAELRDGFAEETGRIVDTMIFTENGTTAQKKGILRTAGVNVEPIASVADITWDDFLNAEAKVPTRVMISGNAKWYMHRTLWNAVKQIKDSEGRYQLMPGAGFVMPWGTSVSLVDVMPTINDVDSDGSTPLAVYGDLRRIKLYRKRGLVMDLLTEGTVHDTDNNAVNLAEQDMRALRAVSRMVALTNKFPEAFTVLGTGTVS